MQQYEADEGPSIITSPRSLMMMTMSRPPRLRMMMTPLSTRCKSPRRPQLRCTTSLGTQCAGAFIYPKEALRHMDKGRH